MQLNIREITRILFILCVSAGVTFMLTGLKPAFFSGRSLEFENGVTFSDEIVDANNIIRIEGEVLLSNGKFLSRLNEENINYIQEKFVGTIMPFAGVVSELPPRWLLCDGAFVPTASYPLLYSKIGNTWGAPQNQFVFKLPNLTDLYMRGATGAKPLASTSNHSTKFPREVTLSLTSTGSQHTHDTWDGVHAEASQGHYGGNISGQQQVISPGGPFSGSGEGTDGPSNRAVSAGMKTTSSTGMTHNHNIPNTNNLIRYFDAETRPDSILIRYYIYAGT